MMAQDMWPIFAVYASSMIASVIGLRARVPENTCAGVIVALAMVHIIPEGQKDAAALDLAYPMDTWCIIIGIMMVFALDSMITAADNADGVCIVCRNIATSTESLDSIDVEAHYTKPLLQPLKHNDNTADLWTWVLEAACASHSIFIGMSLHLEGMDSTPLAIALCFHQAFEGIAMASWFSPNKSVVNSVILITISSLLTPIGIVIGMFVVQSDSACMLYWSAIVECVSGGVMIYVALKKMLKTHAVKRKRGIAEFVLGSTLMSALAIWT